MKNKPIAAAIAIVALFSCTAQSSPVLISDFSSLSSDSPVFDGTWSGGIPIIDQYSQETGFISITPRNGGTPTDEGNFFVAPGVWSGGMDLTNGGTNSVIALTARFDAGNLATNIVITFGDSEFNSASATFTGYGSNFSTQSIAFSSFDPGFNWAAVTDWSISGGLGFGDNFRASFDNLEATVAVPEPATWALLAASLTTVMVLRRRFRF